MGRLCETALGRQAEGQRVAAVPAAQVEAVVRTQFRRPALVGGAHRELAVGEGRGGEVSVHRPGVRTQGQVRSAEGQGPGISGIVEQREGLGPAGERYAQDEEQEDGLSHG